MQLILIGIRSGEINIIFRKPTFRFVLQNISNTHFYNQKIN